MKDKTWGGRISDGMVRDIVLYIKGERDLASLMKKHKWSTTSVYSFIARGTRVAYQRGKIETFV